ncbi:hypothetical protein PGB90_001772 [Kerria lacca]
MKKSSSPREEDDAAPRETLVLKGLKNLSPLTKPFKSCKVAVLKIVNVSSRMLGFLRDCFMYIWNFLFKQSQATTSGALTISESDQNSTKLKTDICTSNQSESIDICPSSQKQKNLENSNEISITKPTEQFCLLQKPLVEENNSISSRNVAPTQIENVSKNIDEILKYDDLKFNQNFNSNLKLENKVEKESNSLTNIKTEQLNISEEHKHNNQSVNEFEQIQFEKKGEQEYEKEEEEEEEEEEEIEKIDEDNLDYEEELEVEEEDDKENELHRKIGEHLKALREQENKISLELSSKLTTPNKSTSEYNFDEVLDQEEDDIQLQETAKNINKIINESIN